MTTILVCGSRDYSDHNYHFMCSVLDNAPFDITMLIHGAARGADDLAGQYARKNFIVCCSHPADWNIGKRAGYIRNAQMLEHHSDITKVAAFINKDLPTSKGTWMMCNLSHNKGIDVFICDARDLSVVRFDPTDYDV